MEEEIIEEAAENATEARNLEELEEEYSGFPPTFYQNSNIREIEAPFSRMLASLYFQMTTLTTVGYGDHLAISAHEQALIILAMLFGVTIFGYMLSSIAEALNFWNNMTAGVQQKMVVLDVWMYNIQRDSGKKIPLNIQK